MVKILRPLNPPRQDPRLARSLTLTIGNFFSGVALVYGFVNLAISTHYIPQFVGGALLLISLVLALYHLVRFFSLRYFTWVGLGVGLLLLTLLLYVSTISRAVCHTLTAKLGVLVLGVAGFSSVCYGVISWLEENTERRQALFEETQTGDDDNGVAVKNLIFVIVAFLSMFVLVNEFVILSSSMPCHSS
jgi:hypothetical protein